MSSVVLQFENNTVEYQQYSTLVERSNISRVMLDFLFEEAIVKGYLQRFGSGHYVFTQKGKLYALENDLIS